MGFLKKLKAIRIKLLSFGRYIRERLGYLKRYFVTPDLPKNEDGKVYVNLGCGVNTSKEFVNVDTRPMPHTHYIHEVEDLPMLQKNSVDLLYASHLLEHVPRKDLHKTLKEWRRVLKPGGVLRFGVPDFDKLVEVYTSSGRNINSIVNQLMGQDPPYDDHHTIWNFAYAKKVLEEAGFKNIRRWDPATSDHHEFGDKSMATLPIDGQQVCISLNIEADKD